MHPDVLDWVDYAYKKYKKTENKIDILEFGSLDINGSVRSTLQHAANTYIGVDMQSGPGVDVIENAKDYDTDIRFDLVVCCEVFEHTPEWPEIIDNSYRLLKDGGLFIATMAGAGRAQHSAVDGGILKPGEYYGNVKASELEPKLNIFSKYELDYLAADLRCWAVK